MVTTTGTGLTLRFERFELQECLLFTSKWAILRQRAQCKQRTVTWKHPVAKGQTFVEPLLSCVGPTNKFDRLATKHIPIQFPITKRIKWRIIIYTRW